MYLHRFFRFSYLLYLRAHSQFWFIQVKCSYYFSSWYHTSSSCLRIQFPDSYGVWSPTASMSNGTNFRSTCLKCFASIGICLMDLNWYGLSCSRAGTAVDRWSWWWCLLLRILRKGFVCCCCNSLTLKQSHFQSKGFQWFLNYLQVILFHLGGFRLRFR